MFCGAWIRVFSLDGPWVVRIGWSAPGSFGVWTRHYHHRRFLWEPGAVGTCVASCWTRGQSGFYGTQGTVGSLVRARDVAIVKRAPGGFLSPLRRPAPPSDRRDWRTCSLWPPGRDTSRSFESWILSGLGMYYFALEARAPLFAWPVDAHSAVFISFTSCAPGLPAGLRFRTRVSSCGVGRCGST